MDLLRFSTAGSVDDGKSTLIGRLLYDSKSIFEDQYEAIRRSTELQGKEGVDLALLTDGLRAEREQGITIDVAYRYFATPKRKFIIADTPGHEQYTRNMVTGASTAELAIILIDARNGVLTQSRRHGFIASLLGIPHLLVAVNKMDLVDYAEDAYNEIVAEYSEFIKGLDAKDVTFIPISALEGDNVVDKSEKMPWYDGGTLLHLLETVTPWTRNNSIDFRFPVQYVNRPNQDFRGFSGLIASGSISVGQEIMVLPSRQTSKVKSIVTFEGDLEKASFGESVTLTLEDEVDISRGDMIVRARNLPTVSNGLDADICWMNESPMQVGKKYLIQHTGRVCQAFVSKVIYRIDVDSLHREAVDSMELNDIGRVEITSSLPLFFDPYKINPPTGSFILIDPDNNNTVAAGMIRGKAKNIEAYGEDAGKSKSSNVVWEGLNISREKRLEKQKHQAAVVWLTGLSGSGKTTIGRAVEERLFDNDFKTMLLDGDHVRHGLCGDLGFGAADRTENIRRVGEVSRLFFEQGSVVICSFVSPFQKDRDFVKSLVPEGSFFEIFVDTPLDVCIERDTKGLYKKAIAGEIPDFTGISSPYESPQNADLVIDTNGKAIEESVDVVLNLLKDKGIIPS